MEEKAKRQQNAEDAAQWAPLLPVLEEACDRLFGEAHADRWDLPRKQYLHALETSARKGLAATSLNQQNLQEYLNRIHAEDLALARACMCGLESAWREFMDSYRPYLRASAAAILKCSAGAPEAQELADSLFAELYGLADGRTGERSLFRYFHGRSSLKTWLRAVLSQRHIDAIRSAKKFHSLDEETEDGERKIPELKTTANAELMDPHRARYVQLFREAMTAVCAELEPRDLERLKLYYSGDKTLAQIGKALGEHESSVSRNLDRIRREIREAVEEKLRRGRTNGASTKDTLSEEQIALCIEYAAEDVPIDLEKMWKAHSPEGQRPQS